MTKQNSVDEVKNLLYDLGFISKDLNTLCLDEGKVVIKFIHASDFFGFVVNYSAGPLCKIPLVENLDTTNRVMVLESIRMVLPLAYPKISKLPALYKFTNNSFDFLKILTRGLSNSQEI